MEGATRCYPQALQPTGNLCGILEAPKRRVWVDWKIVNVVLKLEVIFVVVVVDDEDSETST